MVDQLYTVYNYNIIYNIIYIYIIISSSKQNKQLKTDYNIKQSIPGETDIEATPNDNKTTLELRPNTVTVTEQTIIKITAVFLYLTANVI